MTSMVLNQNVYDHPHNIRPIYLPSWREGQAHEPSGDAHKALYSPQLLRSKQFTSVRHFNSMDARKLQGLFSGTAFICLCTTGRTLQWCNYLEVS